MERGERQLVLDKLWVERERERARDQKEGTVKRVTFTNDKKGQSGHQSSAWQSKSFNLVSWPVKSWFLDWLSFSFSSQLNFLQLFPGMDWRQLKSFGESLNDFFDSLVHYLQVSSFPHQWHEGTRKGNNIGQCKEEWERKSKTRIKSKNHQVSGFEGILNPCLSP